MLIYVVVGARPNFMKMAPVVHELQQRALPHALIHTGQHYDTAMSQVFFDELGLPQPDLYLGVGSASHAQQTARVMVAFEEICLGRRPDLVLVAGDVNSTLAAALAAAKLQIPVGHIEAGLRSHDRSMPEETNRVVVDHLSDLLFTTESSANNNLLGEGIARDHIQFVGNCMVDTLLAHVERAVAQSPWQRWDVDPQGYAVLTLHRPANVDDHQVLTALLRILNDVAEHMPLVFPVHPRTQTKLAQATVPLSSRVRLCEPLGYLDFVGLMARAAVVLTDSGGIQEETTVLGVPCLTLRYNTERPITITHGTNELVGTDAQRIAQCITMILAGQWKRGQRPPLWDGRAAQRIVSMIIDQPVIDQPVIGP